MTYTPEDPASIAQRLRFVSGFHLSERYWLIHCLAALGSRLRSFPYGHVELEISLKDRDSTGQLLTMECWIRRTTQRHLVSTSSAPELAVALDEVRDSLIQQINDANARAEPHDNPAPEPEQGDNSRP